MSRAVFLPTPGDPFLVSYWLRQFASWRDLVDTLYVHISWPQDPEVIDRLVLEIEQAGGTCVHAAVSGVQRDHGQALHAMLDVCTEETVFMCEDDLYVTEPRELASYFERVEHDRVAIGVSRASMSMEIFNALRDRFPHGAGLWPYVVARADDLRALLEPFTARHWAAGETIRGVNYTCVEPCNADTFGAAAMELRGLVDVVEATKAPWNHVGSLSSGPATLDYDHVREAAWSWRTRLTWWDRFFAEWPGGLPEQEDIYRQALARLHGALDV